VGLADALNRVVLSAFVAAVSVSNGELRIALSVPERVLSLHDGDVRIPLASIVSTTPVKDVMNHLRGRRTPGARVPGVLAIGTWGGSEHGESYSDFVAVDRPGAGVVITVAGGPYSRVVIGAENPQDLIAALQLQ
jgi:hypothetical protein